VGGRHAVFESEIERVYIGIIFDVHRQGGEFHSLRRQDE
jgi:hypothetical protein